MKSVLPSKCKQTSKKRRLATLTSATIAADLGKCCSALSRQSDPGTVEQPSRSAIKPKCTKPECSTKSAIKYCYSMLSSTIMPELYLKRYQVGTIEQAAPSLLIRTRSSDHFTVIFDKFARKFSKVSQSSRKRSRSSSSDANRSTLLKKCISKLFCIKHVFLCNSCFLLF